MVALVVLADRYGQGTGQNNSTPEATDPFREREIAWIRLSTALDSRPSITQLLTHVIVQNEICIHQLCHTTALQRLIFNMFACVCWHWMCSSDILHSNASRAPQVGRGAFAGGLGLPMEIVRQCRCVLDSARCDYSYTCSPHPAPFSLSFRTLISDGFFDFPICLLSFRIGLSLRNF